MEDSTFATWLHAAGDRTILLGKYLNGYPGNLGKEYVPPGWDEWCSGEKNQYQQFNYELNENGQIVLYGDAPEDYLQDVLKEKATDFIRRSAAANDNKPFFMWMPTYSPHGLGRVGKPLESGRTSGTDERGVPVARSVNRTNLTVCQHALAGIVNLGRQLGQIWALRWAEKCCRDLT